MYRGDLGRAGDWRHAAFVGEVVPPRHIVPPRQELCPDRQKPSASKDVLDQELGDAHPESSEKLAPPLGSVLRRRELRPDASQTPTNRHHLFRELVAGVAIPPGISFLLLGAARPYPGSKPSRTWRPV